MAEQELAKKERESAGWETASRTLSLILICIFGFIAIITTSNSARVEAILEAMLGGAPLPVLTQVVFSQRMLIMVLLFFLSVLSSLGVLFLKKPVLVILIGGGTALFMIVVTVFIVIACFVPLSSVMMEMNS